MHLCVGGGAATPVQQIIDFLLNETKIDLLQENYMGLDALRFALALRDLEAAEMMEPYWHKQLNNKFPLDSDPPTTSSNHSKPKDLIP